MVAPAVLRKMEPPVVLVRLHQTPSPERDRTVRAGVVVLALMVKEMAQLAVLASNGILRTVRAAGPAGVPVSGVL